MATAETDTSSKNSKSDVVVDSTDEKQPKGGVRVFPDHAAPSIKDALKAGRLRMHDRDHDNNNQLTAIVIFIKHKKTIGSKLKKVDAPKLDYGGAHDRITFFKRKDAVKWAEKWNTDWVNSWKTDIPKQNWFSKYLDKNCVWYIDGVLNNSNELLNYHPPINTENGRLVKQFECEINVKQHGMISIHVEMDMTITWWDDSKYSSKQNQFLYFDLRSGLLLQIHEMRPLNWDTNTFEKQRHLLEMKVKNKKASDMIAY